MREISEQDQNQFDLIEEAITKNMLSLISTEVDGVDACAIARIIPAEEGFTILPLAIIVNDEIFAKLKAPE